MDKNKILTFFHSRPYLRATKWFLIYIFAIEGLSSVVAIYAFFASSGTEQEQIVNRLFPLLFASYLWCVPIIGLFTTIAFGVEKLYFALKRRKLLPRQHGMGKVSEIFFCVICIFSGLNVFSLPFIDALPSAYPNLLIYGACSAVVFIFSLLGVLPLTEDVEKTNPESN